MQNEIKELFCNDFGLNPSTFSVVYDDYVRSMNSQTSTSSNNKKSSAKMNSTASQNERLGNECCCCKHGTIWRMTVCFYAYPCII